MLYTIFCFCICIVGFFVISQYWIRSKKEKPLTFLEKAQLAVNSLHSDLAALGTQLNETALTEETLKEKYLILKEENDKFVELLKLRNTEELRAQLMRNEDAQKELGKQIQSTQFSSAALQDSIRKIRDKISGGEVKIKTAKSNQLLQKEQSLDVLSGLDDLILEQESQIKGNNRVTNLEI